MIINSTTYNRGHILILSKALAKDIQLLLNDFTEVLYSEQDFASLRTPFLITSLCLGIKLLQYITLPCYTRKLIDSELVNHCISNWLLKDRFPMKRSKLIARWHQMTLVMCTLLTTSDPPSDKLISVQWLIDREGKPYLLGYM